MAQEIYNESIAIPFMARFAVFARRSFPTEGQLRMFCMTDDKEEKTLEKQEGFQRIAVSRDVEVLEGKHQWLEFAGNLVPVTKRGDQLAIFFQPFQENRLAFNIKVFFLN
jgi:ankyrin